MPRIISPSEDQVQHYQDLWNRQENYVLQESSLNKLFGETYPNNEELDDILIKVCSLNDFYSTHIFSPFKVAKHIQRLSIDTSLQSSDPSIVSTIAEVRLAKGKKWNFYSFASKYCSHHRPNGYPIYDRYVDRMLRYFRKADHFFKFQNDDLKDYPSFVGIIGEFQGHYGLWGFNLKEIDRYLWQLGKKHFPRKA